MNSVNELHIGQDVEWIDTRSNDTRIIKSAVVLDIKNQCATLVRVYPTRPDTKCYDEGGANYKDHHDNVLLRDCPPPFERLCRKSVRGCYAKADIDHPLAINDTFIQTHDVKSVDNGIPISDRDIQEIKNHPWRDELQKTKPVTLQRAVQSTAESTPAPIYQAQPQPRALPNWLINLSEQTDKKSDDFQFE